VRVDYDPILNYCGEYHDRLYLGDDGFILISFLKNN